MCINSFIKYAVGGLKLECVRSTMQRLLSQPAATTATGPLWRLCPKLQISGFPTSSLKSLSVHHGLKGWADTPPSPHPPVSSEEDEGEGVLCWRERQPTWAEPGEGLRRRRPGEEQKEGRMGRHDYWWRKVKTPTGSFLNPKAVKDERWERGREIMSVLF